MIIRSRLKQWLLFESPCTLYCIYNELLFNDAFLWLQNRPKKDLLDRVATWMCQSDGENLLKKWIHHKKSWMLVVKIRRGITIQRGGDNYLRIWNQVKSKAETETVDINRANRQAKQHKSLQTTQTHRDANFYIFPKYLCTLMYIHHQKIIDISFFVIAASTFFGSTPSAIAETAAPRPGKGRDRTSKMQP